MLSFKDLKLTKIEMLWLRAIYENGGIADPKTFKVKLHAELPKDFNYQNLHRAFLQDNRLNLFGLWIFNPKDQIFENMDKVIKAIKSEILKNPKTERMTAEQITKLTEIPIRETQMTLWHLTFHPGFWSGSSGIGGEIGISAIEFSGDEHIGAYLNYKDIPTLLEKTWALFRMDLYIRPEEAQTIQTQEKPRLCFTKLCHSVFYDEEIWKFNTNAARVIRVLIEAHRKSVNEVHTNDIHAYLPKEIESQSLSQIFKRTDKNSDWKKLVIVGPSGKGFYQINPKYLQNGLSEVILDV